MGTANIWNITGNWAEIYHSCFVPTIIAPWPARTLALAAPQPGEQLLDVACGTGALTHDAAQAVGPMGRVVALDLSPEALAVARLAKRQAGGAEIEWREGAAEHLPFENGSFDVVTCQLGLMFFPDQAAALKEMRRVLAPHGRLALMTWGTLENNPGNAAIAQAWRAWVGEEQAARFNSPHSLSDPAAVRNLLQVAGFAQIDAYAQKDRARFASPRALVCSYGALTGLDADLALCDALCADVTRLLGGYCRPEGLECPTEGVLVRARAG